VTRRTFYVDDLRYEHSMVGLRRQLRRRHGIQDVTTDPGGNTATISFDASCWSDRDIERMIAECGYVCHCPGDDRLT
jgi:hypothetical protein